MASSNEGLSELDKLIHSFEFDNQQLVKKIEKENQLITNLQGNIQTEKEQWQRLEKEIHQFDEDTKRLHQQFTHNRDSLTHLKRTKSVMIDHEMALSKQLDSLKLQTAEKSKFYTEHITNYTATHQDYMKKYRSFPLAIELEKKQQMLEVQQGRLSDLHSLMKEMKEKIAAKENQLSSTRMQNIIVKMAKTKINTLKVEKDIHACLTEKTSLLEKLKAIQDSKQIDEMDSNEINQENEDGSISMEVDVEKCDTKQEQINTAKNREPPSEYQETGLHLNKKDMGNGNFSKDLPTTVNHDSKNQKEMEIQNQGHINTVFASNIGNLKDNQNQASKMNTKPQDGRPSAILTNQPATSSRLPVPVFAKTNYSTSGNPGIYKPPSLRLPTISVPQPPRIKASVTRVPKAIEIAKPVNQQPLIKEPPPPQQYTQHTNRSMETTKLSRMFSAPKTPSFTVPSFSRPNTQVQAPSNNTKMKIATQVMPITSAGDARTFKSNREQRPAKAIPEIKPPTTSKPGTQSVGQQPKKVPSNMSQRKDLVNKKIDETQSIFKLNISDNTGIKTIDKSNEDKPTFKISTPTGKPDTNVKNDKSKPNFTKSNSSITAPTTQSFNMGALFKNFEPDVGEDDATSSPFSFLNFSGKNKKESLEEYDGDGESANQSMMFSFGKLDSNDKSPSGEHGEEPKLLFSVFNKSQDSNAAQSGFNFNFGSPDGNENDSNLGSGGNFFNFGGNNDGSPGGMFNFNYSEDDNDSDPVGKPTFSLF